MRYLKYLLGGMLTAALVACGGGGGNPGTSSGGSGSGSGNGGSGSTTTGTLSIDLLSGSGSSTDSISTVEIATARVTLKNSAGAAVKGAIVTFSQSGASLVTIAPASATALTDAKGQASVEVRAATTSSTGATSIAASATVASVAVTASKAFAVTSAPSSGSASPQDLANALNFLDTNPADKSIVLAGSGGSGRSESATLRFRVVDRNNAPVKSASVTFSVSPPNDVTLNIPTASSDSDGVVTTTVSSKNVATAVVVRATVTGKSITSQSDQLLVTTGVATQAGFDLSASKYHLNSGISGDTSEIVVRIVDANGNPVSDGVPVVFTTDYGAVGTSAQGGCVTANGGCTVNYKVQSPRPPDGVPATVVASTQVGNGTSISDFLQFYLSDPASLSFYDAQVGGNPVNVLDFTSQGTVLPVPSCAKKTFTLYVGTPAGSPAPKGTTVSVISLESSMSVAIISGTPIDDQLASNKRTAVTFEVTPPSGGGVSCVGGGGNSNTASLRFTVTADGRSGNPILTVKYPFP